VKHKEIFWKNFSQPKKIAFYVGNLILGLLLASLSAITFFKNAYLPKYLIIIYPFFVYLFCFGEFFCFCFATIKIMTK